MSTDTGTSTAEVICLTRVTTSSNVAADGQRDEPCIDRQRGRPRVPDRRQNHRVAGLVQTQQCLGTLLEDLRGHGPTSASLT
jgi:hypothetical protein